MNIQFPQRGDLYWIPSEVQSGDDEKDRPLVVISRDDFNKRGPLIVVPFYSQQLDRRKNLRWCAYFKANEGGLPKDCFAMGNYIQSIPIADILWSKGKIGRFTAEQMQRVIIAVRHALRDDSL